VTCFSSRVHPLTRKTPHTTRHDKHKTTNDHTKNHPPALNDDRRWRGDGAYHLPHPGLAFTRYCYYPYCMVHGIQKGGRGGGRILLDSHAIVLQQCGQCRRAERMKGRLIRAKTSRSKTISCIGHTRVGEQLETRRGDTLFRRSLFIDAAV